MCESDDREANVCADNIVLHARMPMRGQRRQVLGQRMNCYWPDRMMAAVSRVCGPQKRAVTTTLHFLTGSVTTNGAKSIEEAILACRELQLENRAHDGTVARLRRTRFVNGVHNIRKLPLPSSLVNDPEILGRTVAALCARYSAVGPRHSASSTAVGKKTFPGIIIHHPIVKVRYFPPVKCVMIGNVSDAQVNAVRDDISDIIIATARSVGLCI